MTDLKKLRELAEKVIESKPTGTGSEWRIHYDYEKATNPETVIALLDRLADAERALILVNAWFLNDGWQGKGIVPDEVRAYLEKYKGEK